MDVNRRDVLKALMGGSAVAAVGSEPSRYPLALRPGSIGRLELPHRIVMGSMHLGVEGAPDAAATLSAFYAERVRGGAGPIVTGGAVHQPQVLVGRDVAEVPHERRHDRVGLALEVGVAEVRDEVERALALGGQRGDDLVLGAGGRLGHVADRS